MYTAEWVCCLSNQGKHMSVVCVENINVQLGHREPALVGRHEPDSLPQRRWIFFSRNDLGLLDESKEPEVGDYVVIRLVLINSTKARHYVANIVDKNEDDV